MPAYIEEKLISIKGHAKNLLKGTCHHRGGADQEYVWILQATRSIELEMERLTPTLEAFWKVKEAVEAGGDPAFIVKWIQKTIEEHRKELGLP